MPVDGGARGPGRGGNSNVSPEKHFKRDGPGSNLMDGPSMGRKGHQAAGMTRGEVGDMRSGSPMQGPSAKPSMAGVLKYIRERGTGEKKPSNSEEPLKAASSAMDKVHSPYPTGGEPLPEHDQGNDSPGESEDEEEQESSCGHPGCTAHGKKQMKYSQSNRERLEPSSKGGPF